jgi:predicted metal-dependent RNase
MDKVVAEYLSGKITYKEAINIMYPMYLADVEMLQEKINKTRAEKTERVRSENERLQ